MENYRKTKLMTHLFENQVIQNNNRSAVSDQDLAVTYGQLNTIANRIANRILLETSHAPIALLDGSKCNDGSCHYGGFQNR